MIARGREIWQKRTPRERRAIAGGAGLVLLAFAYAYVWLPVSQERERLAQAAPELRMRLVQMRQHAGEVERLRAASKPASAGLQVVIEQSAQARNLRKAIAQIEAEGAARLRVRLPAVRSSDWFAWVADLQKEHGIRIEVARMEALEEVEMVSVAAVFSRGG